MHERIVGLEQIKLKPGDKNPLDQAGHDLEKVRFPGFTAQYAKTFRTLWMLDGIDITEMEKLRGNSAVFRLTERLYYRGDDDVKRDMANLRAGLEGLAVSDAFITVVTPTTARRDEGVLDFYDSVEEYQYALADILNQEYKTITDAGFIIQLDRAGQDPAINVADLDERAKALDAGIDLMNYALRDVPEDRVRLHWCGGSSNRPHTEDIDLADSVQTMLRLNVGAYGFEGATPRHEHEYRIWQDIKLPEGKILIPGVISQSTSVVEHPECVAWRIQNYANLVGRENVIAGVDCAFSQDWDVIRVNPEIQWAKLNSLSEGAAIASRELWKR